MTLQTRGVISVCLVAYCFCEQLLAGNPSLELITPSVGSRGTEFVVVAKGAFLKNIRSVVFYDTGVRCERIEGASDEQATLHMVAEPSCKLGAHAFRLLGDNGFSELRTLTVSPFPTVQEDKESENQEVPSNRTVLGTLESDDVDTFQMRAKTGERISAEAVAVRLGVSLFDTALTLRDPDGVVLIRVDDTPMLNQDPSFSILAPRDGIYTIEITSAGANADADSQYALHVGNFPRPYSVFPLSVRDGSQNEVTFASSDNQSVDSVVQRIRFDSIGKTTTQFIEHSDGGLLCPSPISFRVSTYDQFCEDSELDKSVVGSGVIPVRNDTVKAIRMAPISMNGVIRETGEVDTFRFAVNANESISLEVFASRLGSLLDAVVEVRDQNDRVVSSGDDFDSHDTRLVFEAKTGETYTVSIWDKRKNSGAAYCYNVEVAPLQRSVTAFLPRRNKLSQVGQTIAVPQGNRALALMGIRRDRLDGETSLSFEELSKGVSVNSPVVEDSAFLVPVVFTADALLPPSGALVAVKAMLRSEQMETTLIGGFEQNVDLVNGPADAIFQLNRVDRMAVATVNPVPYSIEMVKPTTPLAADGTLDVIIRVKREAGFDSPIDVAIPLLPDWVDCPAKTRIPADKDSGTITLRANIAAKAATWPLVAEGMAGLAESSPNPAASGAGMGMRSRRSSAASLTSVCSSLHSIVVCDSPARGSIHSVSAERGAKVEMVCRLELSDALPDLLVATLEDLPNRVNAAPIQIKRADKSVTFQLKIDDDAPIGTFESIVCRLSGTIDNQNVSYCVARNTKLIIAAPGASQKDESGRPLSPLEALRLRKNKQGS